MLLLFVLAVLGFLNSKRESFMSFKISLTAALVGTILAASASAGGHTSTEQRIIAMKAMGGQMRTVGGMAPGNGTYDAAAVISALEIMRNAAATAQPLFAEPTPDNEETRARPEIWVAGSDFDAQLNGLIADLDAAIAGQPADAATLGPLFGAVAGNCKSCHEKYRAPEN